MNDSFLFAVVVGFIAGAVAPEALFDMHDYNTMFFGIIGAVLGVVVYVFFGTVESNENNDDE